MELEEFLVLSSMPSNRSWKGGGGERHSSYSTVLSLIQHPSIHPSIRTGQSLAGLSESSAGFYCFDCASVYLSTAARLQRVLQHACVRVLGLVRDEVGLLGVTNGPDPGQSRQLLAV